jgi:hypothetical protein
MDQLLKQSTGATIDVGPILNADGTAYVTDNLTNADFLISKNGIWSALHTAVTAAPHVAGDVQGMFEVVLDTTDTATLGRLVVTPNKATLAGPKSPYMVLAAAMFDGLVTAGKVPAIIAVGDDTNRGVQF